jgi:hypothetical protein
LVGRPFTFGLWAVVFGSGADWKSCLAFENYCANEGSGLNGRKYTQTEASVDIYPNKSHFYFIWF